MAMGKWVLLVALLVAAAALGGCLEPKPTQNAKELYKSLLEKSKSLPDGKYSHEMSITYGEGMAEIAGEENPMAGMLAGLKIGVNIEVFKKGENTKSIMTMSFFGMSTITFAFERGGKIVACTEASGGLLGAGQTQMTCQAGNPEQGSLYEEGQFYAISDELLDSTDLALVGEKNYNGRACWEFKTKMGAETMQKLIEEQQKESGAEADPYELQMYENMGMESTVCLDKELGLAVKQEAAFLTYGDAGEGKNLFVLSLELKGFDPNGANGIDFAPPLDFGIEAPLCIGNQVSLTLVALNPVQGNVEVKLGEYNYEDEVTYTLNGTVDIGSLGIGDKKDVELEFDQDFLGTQQVEVCSSAGKCSQEICYEYDSLGIV